MKCRNVRKKLSAYQDGELGPEQQVRISTHLEGCLSCRLWYADYKQVWRMVGNLPDIDPLPEFYPELQEKVVASRRLRLVPRLREVFQLLPDPLAMAALLIIGLIIGVYLADAWRQGRFDAGRMVAGDSRESVTIAAFKAFDAIPPGSLAHGYVKMAAYEEEVRR